MLHTYFKIATSSSCFLSTITSTWDAYLEILITLVFSTLIFIPQHLPLSICLSFMLCSTVSSLTSCTRSSVHVTVRIIDMTFHNLYKPPKNQQIIRLFFFCRFRWKFGSRTEEQRRSDFRKPRSRSYGYQRDRSCPHPSLCSGAKVHTEPFPELVSCHLCSQQPWRQQPQEGVRHIWVCSPSQFLSMGWWALCSTNERLSAIPRQNA